MKMRVHALVPAVGVLAVCAAGPATAAGESGVASSFTRGSSETTAAPGFQAAGRARPDARRLVDAAQRRDLAAARALIEEGIDVDAPQADGATALAWAAHRDDLAMAELLLQAGAGVDIANDLGVTPLMLASENGSVSMVELLLQAGADPNAARPAGGTALMMAAQAGDPAVLRRLIAAGADVDAATRGGHTALMWAVAERHLRAVNLLAEIGADLHARTTVHTPPARTIVREVKVLSRFEAVNPASLPRDGDQDPPRAEGGFTPLLYAVLAGDPQIVRVLLAAGADADDTAPDGVSALMLALIKRHEETALLLLDAGADPGPDEAGFTALHLASATGSLAVADALLARGADPNARLERPQRLTNSFEIGVFTSPGSGRLTQIGSTPFLVAAKSADARMMRLLADAGADPHLTTDDGTTALMLAAGLGKRAATDITYYDWTEEKAAEALAAGLALGLDINAANEHGETALHAAAYHNANAVIDFLVDNGAHIDALNAAEQTPLRLAEGHLICCTTFVRHAEAASRLRELGADPAAGIQLTFGLTNYGDEGAPSAPRPQESGTGLATGKAR
jgi:ankyrin repeat protein